MACVGGCASFTAFLAPRSSFETLAVGVGGGLASSPVKASNSGCNVSQRSSWAKRIAASLEGFVRKSARRSLSCLQASWDAVDVASRAGAAEGGGVASLVGFVSAAPADAVLSRASLELGAAAPDVASDTGGAKVAGAAAPSVAVSGRAPFGLNAPAVDLASVVGGPEVDGAVSPAVVSLDRASLGLTAPTADFVSASSSEAGDAASRADVAPGAAPSGVGAPADCGAWLRLSKSASTCGCTPQHLNSSLKRTASSREALA